MPSVEITTNSHRGISAPLVFIVHLIFNMTPAIDPHDHAGTPEFEEVMQHHRDLRDSHAYDLMLQAEESDYNHGYIPRRPGR